MHLKENHALFQREIARRGIQHLVHFTTTINLLSIFEQGRVLCRDAIDRLGIDCPELAPQDYIDYMDSQRLDGLTEYVNLSVERPNRFLLRTFQRRNDLSWFTWCILRINAKHIYRDSTLFSVTNAASRAAANYGIDGSFENFTALFQDTVATRKHTLRRGRLPPHFTTDVQAEVLVKNAIPVEDVHQVCFRTKDNLQETRAAFSLQGFNTDNFVVTPDLFVD